MRKKQYECVAVSERAFVQQLICYVRNHYIFYTTIGPSKRRTWAEVDTAIVEKWGINISDQSRARRKAKGHANMQYIRFGDLGVIMLTPGFHPWYEKHISPEGIRQYKTLRSFEDHSKNPLRAGPYSISSVLDWEWTPGKPIKHRAKCTLNRQTMQELRAVYHDRATHWSVDSLSTALARTTVQYLPYRGVRNCFTRLVHEINKRRKVHGYTDEVPYEALKMPSIVRSVPVFHDISKGTAAEDAEMEAA